MKLLKFKSLCCAPKTSGDNPTDIELAPRSADILLPPTTATVPTAILEPTAPFPFLRLPPELRLQVYAQALHVPDENGFCIITKETGIPEPPLLFTCKAIRNEAIKTFYTRNFFKLIMDTWHPATEVLFSRIIHMWKDDELDWRQDLEGRSWKNLMLWLQLCQTGETHTLQKLAVSRHERDVVEPQACPIEMRFVYSIFKILAAMKERPWEEIQDVLDGLRPGLVQLGWEWGMD